MWTTALAMIGFSLLQNPAFAEKPPSAKRTVTVHAVDGVRLEVIHNDGVLTLVHQGGALHVRDGSGMEIITPTQQALPPVVEVAHAAPAVELPAVVEAPVVANTLLIERPASAPASFPEPWRTAILNNIAKLPAPIAARVQLVDVEARIEKTLATWLDERSHYPPALAVEELAVGASARATAIAKARADRVANADRFETYRRFLPARDAQVADAFMARTDTLADKLNLDWPLTAKHRVSSSFGYRKHPILGTNHLHNGIDLAAPIGTSVLAPAAGSLVTIDENRVSGRYVTIDHGDGVQTTYCHLHALPNVPVGTPVRRGQRFATVGNSGRSTGPHLHYMVRIDGEAVDPAPLRNLPQVLVASAD